MKAPRGGWSGGPIRHDTGELRLALLSFFVGLAAVVTFVAYALP